MKLPLAIGLLSLLPVAAWAVPVTSSIGSSDASIAAQAGPQRSPGGMAFGGFFTLYSFAVVSPLVPAAAILPISAVVPDGEPAVGHPYVKPLTDEIETVGEREPEDTTELLLIRVTEPVLPVDETDTLWQVISDPLPPYTAPVLPAATDIPEPSSLGLAALAAVALAAFTGNAARRQSRNSRRKVLPTGAAGRSTRKSTIFGRS